MSDRSPPKVDEAPGLVWRERKDGWSAYWQCRTDKATAGFKPRVVPLFRGIEPSNMDCAHIQSQCQMMQAQMLAWGVDLKQPDEFDGTIHHLAHLYQTDKDSSFKKNRFRTRKNYAILLKRIVRDHGADRVENLKGRDMLRWHENWAIDGKIPMAHSLMRMIRALFGFGMTLLECPHCTRMCAILSKQRYEMGKSRTDRLTAEMATLIRAEAHAKGFPAIALAQAFQFECMFRQKDILGEMVPVTEPGVSDIVVDGDKWLWGIRWSEIDGSLKLKHVTSKRKKEIEIDLRLADMVLTELKLIYGFDLAKGHDRSMLPASGPVIIEARTGLPYRDDQFRAQWRKLARAVGIPDHIRNQDSRAGAISEATDAGAMLEDVRHAATHSDISQTQKYSRGATEKAAGVLKLRVAHRNKSGT
jgi:hypothetical protein